MSLLNFIGKIFEPAAKLVDDLHTSAEEKMVLKAEILKIQTGVLGEALQLEKAAIEAKTSIILQEAKADSWLTRSWRPILMLTLAGSVLAYWFGLTPSNPVTGESIIPIEIINRMYSLVQIGVGGYIGSRGAEKIIPKVVEAMKAKEQV
jgi:hypothetical protein